MPMYDLGDGVNLRHLVYDRDDVLTDANVTLTVVKPDSSSVPVTATRTSLGQYDATYVPDQTGGYTYEWVVAGAVTDVSRGTFTVADSTLTTPAAGAYASRADLAASLDPLPVNADQLLVRASREIARMLLCSVYDPTDAGVIAALKAATVEQVLGNRQDGDESGLGGVTTSATDFTLGKLTVKKAATVSTPVPRTGGLVDQAYSILQAAGLLGGGPGEPVNCW